MILSLKYKFELSSRRALYITRNRATVYHWYKGHIGASFSFDTSEAGLRNFELYINEHSEDPVYILVDLNEEEYKQDFIPHVLGRDRRSLISRKKARLFRNPAYSHAIVQGREIEGRRDDRVLFTCIADNDSTAPWVNRLCEQEVPIAGIYSTALISYLLLDHLDHASGPSLVVSLHKNSGLRQTFFKDKAFRFSRLVKAPRYGTEPYAPFIHEEIQKMLRYLRSMREITNDSLVHIYILGDDRLCADIEHVYKNRGGLTFKPILLPALARKIGLRQEFPDPFSDKIYAYLLLANKPGNIYATGRETKHFQIRRLRNGIYATNLLVLIGSLVWGGLMFLEAVTLKQQAMNASEKVEFYRDRYALAREKLLETPVPPESLKTAMEITQALKAYKASPQDMMLALSYALGRHEDIQIDSMRWLESQDPDRTFDSRSRSTQEYQDTKPASDNQERFNFYQIAEIEGHISPFNGNYRMAIASIDQFIETIKAQKNIVSAKILAQPLDVSSQANLQGAAEAVSTEANYRIRLVLGINNEE